MAGAGAGAGAEIMDKGGAEKEPEPKINNFGSAKLIVFVTEKWVKFRQNINWEFDKSNFRRHFPVNF